jgi:DNA-binding LacI/PurR family transcriptional regulator
MKVSIHEVARQAEVSISTVSRAFNAPQLLHPDTLARVLEVAGALGYQPNRAARGLITGTTGNLGLIVPDVANPFFPGLVKSAQSRARSADYAVFLADTDEDPAVELELIRAMAKQVDGIILASSRMSEAQVLEAAGLTSLAFVNRLMRGIPAVTLDSAGGMRQALEHLIALGHRRVVFLNGPRNSWSNRERRRGLRSVAGRSGLEVIELGPYAPRFEAGMQAADTALATDATAILAYNDLMALGVLARLSDRRVRVPDAVSVAGFDDIPLAAMCTPSLTTVAMPTEAAGRAAVDLLLAVLAQREPVRKRVELPTQLMVRDSTAPVPSRSPPPSERPRASSAQGGT